MTESGRVVSRESCPKCGSADNVAVYEDGHRHCFGMGCDYHTFPDDTQRSRKVNRVSSTMITGEIRALRKRGIDKATCQKFGIRAGRLGDNVVLAMDYKDADGNLVAQKVRKEPKSFTVLGDLSKATPLFGQHLWGPSGKRVIITEGELDAAAMCQANGLRYPVVSLKNGAQSARKSVAEAREWLESYDEVVLAFDADEAGIKAASEAASVLTPGKVRVADFSPFGFKDANEAVQRADSEGNPELIKNLLKSIYEARPWRPDGVVSLRDIRDRVLTPIQHGRPWPWSQLNRATFGRRIGDVIGFGAGTGVGKTDLFTQTIAWDVQHGIKCGVLALEQDVGETGKRIAGKIAGKRFHVPDGSWSDEEFREAWASLESTDLVKLYDNFGAMDWETVKSRIRYMHDVDGCEHIFLDHLTALAAGEDDERTALERIMAEAAAMAKGRMVLHYVSHLATPEGKPHEEGGRVMIRHFKGSRAIGFWSHFMFGLERNQQAEDADERVTTTLRCLKDRNTGQATGKTFTLKYNETTGLLEECTEFDNDTIEHEAAGAGF